MAGCGLSTHDMRRTLTNIALKLGVDLYKAELLTNHVASHSVTLTHYVETNDLRESSLRTCSASETGSSNRQQWPQAQT